MTDLDWMFQPDPDSNSGDVDPLAWMFSEPGALVGNTAAEYETTRNLPSPITHARREAKREFISDLKRTALTELIKELPPPNVDLYIVGNGLGAEQKRVPGGIARGVFDFGSFVPVVIGYMGNRDCTAYISTWTMNAQHAKTLLACLDDKRLKSLAVCTGLYFKRREPAIWNLLATGLSSRGQRILAFRNHCKIIAIEAPDGRTCVITGSPNMSAQPRHEQYVLTTAPDVYAFFRDSFFLAMLNSQGIQADRPLDGEQ